MSSIWKQFKNKNLWDDTQNLKAASLVEHPLKLMDRSGYTLVNITKTYTEGLHHKRKAGHPFPAPVRPPYNKTWVEWSQVVEGQAFHAAVAFDLSRNTVRSCAFASARGEAATFLLAADFTLDPEGNIDGSLSMSYQTDPVLRNLGSSVLFGALFHLSLLNCKNIRLSTITGPHRNRKHKAKSHSEWKTLEISVPGVSTSANGKESEYVGLTRHHLVRGHFADYRNGPGMFGKESLRGVYWVCPHARGNAEHGSIIKDYSLKPAKEDSDE